MQVNRDVNINQIKTRKKPWDIVVIGGGATGLGIAVDAASRNFSVLLLEKYDLAKGTSSRSTKLVHGGVRYLQQGNISLVYEALRERGLMKQNAPHLVHDMSFVIPSYEWWDGPFYTVGLKIYDMMAGKLGLGSSQYLSREKTIEYIPTVEQKELRGGVIYHDGQFDDARMAVSLALTAADYGAVIVNYCGVVGLLKEEGVVVGVEAADGETGEEFFIPAKVVINATGVFVDEILKMDEPRAPKSIQPSQGVHLVLEKDFLPGRHAFLIPQTSDGRVLFAVPWHGKVILGTTDTMVDSVSEEPRALSEEIRFILNNASQYLRKVPSISDVKSVFAGLRPLAVPSGSSRATKEISRGHKVVVSDSGLITLLGGKWTTYRKMAEDAVDHAIMVGDLHDVACITERLLIHGYSREMDHSDPLHIYGRDRDFLEKIETDSPEYRGFLSQPLLIRKSQVVWAVRQEMARTVEDVLARRTRALFLDAQESIEIAEETAKIMAKELDKSELWINDQVAKYEQLAANYRIWDL